MFEVGDIVIPIKPQLHALDQLDRWGDAWINDMDIYYKYPFTVSEITGDMWLKLRKLIPVTYPEIITEQMLSMCQFHSDWLRLCESSCGAICSQCRTSVGRGVQRCRRF